MARPLVCLSCAALRPPPAASFSWCCCSGPLVALLRVPAVLLCSLRLHPAQSHCLIRATLLLPSILLCAMLGPPGLGVRVTGFHIAGHLWGRSRPGSSDVVPLCAPAWWVPSQATWRNPRRLAGLSRAFRGLTPGRWRQARPSCLPAWHEARLYHDSASGSVA